MEREYKYVPSYEERPGLINLKALYRQTKKNAVKRGIRFDLSARDLDKLCKESAGRCSVSGIRFNRSLRVGRCRPYAPSIDRIENDKGYSFDNCRLVCVAVNCAISDFGLEILEHIAIGMFKHVRFNPRVLR